MRKNRETAILSQKRKREKIEELDRITEMYNQLQHQVRIVFVVFILKNYNFLAQWFDKKTYGIRRKTPKNAGLQLDSPPTYKNFDN